jgi:rubrerythrin
MKLPAGHVHTRPGGGKTMAVHSLKDILGLCLSIERKAVSFYGRLAENSGSAELRSFWKNMSAQEAGHVKYWLRLIELEDRGGLINIFDRPEATALELEKLSAALGSVMDSELPESPVQALLAAYKLEFMIMHPAFPALFRIMDKMTGDPSPEQSYREHIGGLIGQARRMGVSNQEFEMIADLIDRQWTVSQELAVRMAEIRELRSLIPICSYCKNVRNDKGYWEKVEKYIEAHFPAEFSHGICPDCIRKNFPEFYDDEPKKK